MKVELKPTKETTLMIVASRVQVVMKFVCTFRVRERCSAFILPFLLMKQN